MTTILLADRARARLAPRLATIAPGLSLVSPGGDGWAGPVEDAEIALLSDELWTPDMAALDRLATLPRLRWVHSETSGTDDARFAALARRGVVVTRSPGTMAVPMAEFTLGLMLRVVKRMDHWADEQRLRRWGPTLSDECGDLAGRTLGVVGLGHVGRQAARLAAACGVRVLGVRRHPQPVEHVADVWPVERLDDLLAASDFVLLALPLTPETRGLLDARRLARMRRDAWLINLARGPIVDERALVDALVEGRLGGACLDVFAREPLAPDHPLWTLPNVVVTPHIAATSPSFVARVDALFCELLARYLAGAPLPDPLAATEYA